MRSLKNTLKKLIKWVVNKFEIVRYGKIIDANFTLIFERFLFKYETTFLQICWLQVGQDICPIVCNI